MVAVPTHGGHRRAAAPGEPRRVGAVTATATRPGVAISDQPVRLVSVTGPLDVDGLGALRGHLARLVDGGDTLLAVDLAGVSECDDRLLGMLAAVATALRARGGRLRLVGLPDTVLAALSSAPLPEVLMVYARRPCARGRRASSRTARRATRSGLMLAARRTPGSSSRGRSHSARAWNSVATGPGFTEWTRTPCGPTSRRSPSTNPSTARLLAAYAVSGGSDAHAAVDETISTSPSRRRSIPGSTSRVRSISAAVFVPTTRSTSSPVMSTTAPR
jgi:anti-anti-sigma regulatory factor